MFKINQLVKRNHLFKINHKASQAGLKGHWIQQVGVVLVVVGFGFLGFGWFFRGFLSESSETRPHSYLSQNVEEANRRTCRVLTVYDGDTLGCDLNQNHKIDKPTEQIRMIGIDTPEMHYSQKNKTGEDEPGAQAASKFTQNSLKNKLVTLEQDKRPEDKYGRTLAYIYLENQSISLNEQLLAKGLATHFFIPPNTRYESQFLEAEAEAQTQRLGIWAPSP